MSIKVIFFSIKLDHTKLHKIIGAAHYHFQKKEHLQFIVADDKSLEFVDHLLWKHPKDSFLPHAVSNEPCEDLVLISKNKQILNGARYCFNLLPFALQGQENQTIYEFDDFTSIHKKNLSKAKYRAYKDLGYAIEAR